MSRIYIHVGAGKTGTSTLQSFFRLNEKLLKSAGFVLPTAGRVSLNNGIQHHKLANHGPYKCSAALEMWKDVRVQDKYDMIVSSEDFHNRISQSDGPAFFTAVRDALSNYDIRIVFYVRRQSEWLRSAYGQFMRGPSETRTFAEFCATYQRNLPGQILQFAEVFGDEALAVRPYGARLVGGDVCRDFLHVLGLGEGSGFDMPLRDMNVSLSPDAVEFKRRVNQLRVSEVEQQKILKCLVQYSISRLGLEFKRETWGGMLLDIELALEIEEFNKKAYSEIARRFRPDLGSDLFGDQLETRLLEKSASITKASTWFGTEAVERFILETGDSGIQEVVNRAFSSALN